jgi:Domain of unknown function (DUF5054)
VPAVPAVMAGDPVPAERPINVAGWSVAVDPRSGDVTSLTSPAGTKLAARDGSLIGYRYESYDAADVTSHLDSYLTLRPEWAILDHAKPGLANAASARSAEWTTTLAGIVRGESAIAISTLIDDVAHRELGAPAAVELVLRPVDDQTCELMLIARGKPANRMPEASFLTFTPQGVDAWQFRKLGLWQPADRTASHGGGQLQAVEAIRAAIAGTGSLEIAPLDTPLVAPLAWNFMTFDTGQPDFAAGIRFNLHNNKWGTNFPMWWEGDLLARFVVTLT